MIQENSKLTLCDICGSMVNHGSYRTTNLIQGLKTLSFNWTWPAKLRNIAIYQCIRGHIYVQCGPCHSNNIKELNRIVFLNTLLDSHTGNVEFTHHALPHWADWFGCDAFPLVLGRVLFLTFSMILCSLQLCWRWRKESYQVKISRAGLCSLLQHTAEVQCVCSIN